MGFFFFRSILENKERGQYCNEGEVGGGLVLVFGKSRAHQMGSLALLCLVKANMRWDWIRSKCVGSSHAHQSVVLARVVVRELTSASINLWTWSFFCSS